MVHSASVNDSQRMPHLLKRIVGKVSLMKAIFADQGYEGTPGGLVWRCFGWLLELVEREKDQKGFAVQEKRWVVERTFSCMGGSRRLAKDYEHLPGVSEAMVKVSAMRLMVRWIA